MVHITLFPPNDKHQQFEAENYTIRDEGVLWFRVGYNPIAGNPDDTDITTTVPFIIRQAVSRKPTTK
jgi:hypothetical protein